MSLRPTVRTGLQFLTVTVVALYVLVFGLVPTTGPSRSTINSAVAADSIPLPSATVSLPVAFSAVEVEKFDRPKSRPTPKPIVAPIQITATKPTTYTVVAGDNLSKIAERFGTSVAALVCLNKQIKNPNLIYAGWQLSLVGDTMCAAPAAPVAAAQPVVSRSEVHQETKAAPAKAATSVKPAPKVVKTQASVNPAPIASSSRASIAINYARAQLGKPYVWGAAGPNAFDCSGLTMAAWRAAGVSLGHFTGSQYSAGTHVSYAQLQPGDLVFFYSGHSHVGLYIGNGQMIDAPNSHSVVKIEPLAGYWASVFSGAVRL